MNRYETIDEVEKTGIDHIEEVRKFNPYHDARGRFSSAQGYTSFTTVTRDPKKQHMADMAIARMKQQAAQQAPPKPTKNYDHLGFADQDDADYHQLYNGKGYYQQQNLTPAQKKACDNYMEANTEPGSLYSHSQNMNWTMATQGEDALTGKHKQTFNGIMSAMHNVGYNVELSRYDHDGFLTSLLSAAGLNGDYTKMDINNIKKALVGKSLSENKILSTSTNDLAKAPQSSKNVFANRAVKVIYRTKAGVQGMMPGKGPGGDLGELLLAPTNGKYNPPGKIVDVRRNGVKARKKGSQVLDREQIEIIVELG